MDFKKKFDYQDISMFLPDNYTLGTADYYQKRFPTLPEEECQILEVLSRDEYKPEDINLKITEIQNEQLEFNKKLELELMEREQEGKEEPKEETKEEEIAFNFSDIEL
jgi:hypothetical protein